MWTVIPRFLRAHDAITTSLLRQNDVATSFWRNNDVIISSCARWDQQKFGLGKLFEISSGICWYHWQCRWHSAGRLLLRWQDRSRPWTARVPESDQCARAVAHSSCGRAGGVLVWLVVVYVAVVTRASWRRLSEWHGGDITARRSSDSARKL